MRQLTRWSPRAVAPLFALLLLAGPALAVVPAVTDGPGSPPAAPALAGEYSPPDEHGRYLFLVELAEPGLLHRVERAPGERFDPSTPRAQVELQQVMAEQASHIDRMERALGREAEVTHRYLVTHSGFATRLTREEAVVVRGLRGVVSVAAERLYELATFRGPEFIGAGSIWDGTAVPGGVGTLGEGMVIGVLDTGIAPTHPSFANDATCGHGGPNPNKLLSFLDCASTDGSGLCNGPNPLDGDGHGSHTASTAGGNALDTSATPPPFTDISGVAPCASIRAYKVCPTSCPQAQIQAGMNSILLHGDVDVMNFSISGGTSPWLDNDRRKLDLVDAGVFVAASAGNTSTGIPNPVGQVNHRGPWVFTVAASTHDASGGRLSASGPGVPPPATQNITASRGSASPVAPVLEDKPIRHFIGQPSAFEGCTAGEDGAPGDLAPFPPGFFTGAVALIHRGTCPFTKKITNAFNAGADFVIIRNNQPTPVSMDTTGQPNIPAYSIDQAPGEALVAFVDANPATATVDFEGLGDVLAGFSFRGPTPSPLQNLTKPDITGPGVSIYAAVPGGYANISGTSMSGPHAAGAATLVRAVQPAWTVSEVKSALMMTGFTGGTKENGTTPWDTDDVGSGRLDLTKAARAGLVLDEVFANYLAANPAIGGDVRTLNLPAVRDMDCTPSCSWTRTVRNTLTTPSSWTAEGFAVTPGFIISISPSSFTFGGGLGETQELTITATPQTDLTAAVAFGEVVLSENGGLSPDLRITVSIRGDFVATGPIADITPSSFSFVAAPGGSASGVLDVGNTGVENLVWSIATDGVSGFDSGVREFDGPFAIGNWTLTNTPSGVDGSFNTNPGPPIELYVVGGNANVGGSTDFWIVIPEDGEINFDWGFQSTDIEEWDHAGYVVNGAYTQLATNATQVPYFNGSATVPVAAGDTFAFRAHTEDGQFGAGTLGVTNFVFTAGAEGPCDDPTAVPWLDVDPTAGVTPPGGNVPVDVDVDATGLPDGTYEAALCVTTNDPAAELVVIPVEFTVGDFPIADITPASFTFQVETGGSDTQVLDVGNLGAANLVWSIEEAEGPAGAGTEVVSDGGFEAGSPNPFWSEGSTNFGTPLCTVALCGTGGGTGPHGGSWWAWFGGIAAATETGFVAQNVTIPAGGSAALSFWLEIPAAGTTGFLEVRMGTDVLFSVTEANAPSYATYTQVVLDVSAYADGVSRELRFHSTTNAGAGALNFFVDDVSLIAGGGGGGGACDNPVDVPWLSVNPDNGVTPPGGNVPVDVTVNATGLEPGSYSALLCVATNDPTAELVEVPVDLTVGAGPAPVIAVSPTSMSASMLPDQTDHQLLTISNQGNVVLEWTVEEAGAPSRAHFPPVPRYVEHRFDPEASVGADPHATEGWGEPAGRLPLGGPVPAYSTTGFTVVGYVTLDATVPGSVTVINPTQPTNMYAATFIDNDFTKEYMVASSAGNQPINTFGTIDTSTGVFTSQGLVTGGAGGTWTSMKWDHSTSTLFAANVPAGGNNQLFTIDPVTLQATLVGPITGPGVSPTALVIAIAISPEGLMYGIDIADDVLLAIDKTTGAAAVIGPVGVNANFAQDMDFDQSTGILYWAGYLGGGNSQIFTVNLATGLATSLGPVAGGSELLSFSIAIPGSTVDCDNPNDVPWLDLNPTFGLTPPGGDSLVQVHISSVGLAPGDYSAGLCVVSNDPVNPLVVVPVNLTVEAPAPIAQVAPDAFAFTVPGGGSDADVLSISNLPGASADLEWSITTDVPAGYPGIGTRTHDPALNEPINFPSFQAISPANGGSPVVFSVPGGVLTQGLVVGFDFVGTVTGITGNGSWASDLCMIVQAPGGATYAVGGFSGTQPGCNVNTWDFDGSGSDPDGTYASSHDGVFPAVGDAGDWTFTFVNDWNSTLAATMNWSNVTVTLLKEPFPICDDITLVPWLSVAPDAGVTTVGQTSLVDVMVDATGLPGGSYEAVLCVETNDPVSPLVVVPVSLEVEQTLVIFIDGFESGDAGQWSSCQGCT